MRNQIRQIQSISNVQVAVFWARAVVKSFGIISKIAQCAIDAPEYQKHCSVEGPLAVVSVPFREAEP